MWDLTEACTSSNAQSPPIPCLDFPAHQSGINSLAVWVEKLGQQEGGCLVTVASGGDDGQLTVSMIRVQYPQEGQTGGSRGFSQVSESLIPLQTQFQHPNRLLLQLHSQYHIPLAHAAPVTALKLLSPGLVVSTAADQRVCLWRVDSASVSHIAALCSHVADAAGLTVWEGQIIEEGQENTKRKTPFESEQEIAIWRGKGSQTGLKTLYKTAEGETGSIKGKETANEAVCGEPVEALSVTIDPVCKSSEKDSESAEGCRNQTENISVDETGSEANSKSKESREKTGWVLVCGQGFQLLRVRNTETDAEIWTTRREEEKEGLSNSVKVTLHQKST